LKQRALIVALAGLTMTASTAAMADVVVKLGFAGPLTGPVSHLGKDEQYGAQLALDDANAKGVVLGGQKVRFELMPRTTRPTRAPPPRWPSASSMPA
jgi:branched-chain amino acid transport system substrate-binding protein